MKWLVELGLLLVLAGFGLVFIGSGNVSTGGVIFLGPFPIVFGSGPGGGTLALLSVVIGGIMLALFLLYGWRASRTSTLDGGALSNLLDSCFLIPACAVIPNDYRYDSEQNYGWNIEEIGKISCLLSYGEYQAYQRQYQNYPFDVRRLEHQSAPRPFSHT
jgi:uncharacterized membrane protein